MCTLDTRFNALVEELNRYFQDKISLEELNTETLQIENIQHFLVQERDWSQHILIVNRFELHLDYAEFKFQLDDQSSEGALRYDFRTMNL